MPETEGAVGLLAAERIRIAIDAKEMLIDRQMLSVTISCGLAQVKEGDSAVKLIDRADVALYRVKEAGRNRSFWHDGFVTHPIVDLDQPVEEEGEFSDICDALRQRLVDVSSNQPLT